MTDELLEGLEYHVLRSVGIDIGSSTSHLMVSRLVIRRRGSDLSAEFVVTERRALYRSPIWLTPYRPGDQAIDTSALQRLFEGAYDAAGISPDEVDTGAVVITGEALKKENAEQIARMVARLSGRFICVSAGPNHEALLAAHGSGSVSLSEASSGIVVNVDMGGGTTKVSVLDSGRVTHIEAFSVGARLLAFDEDGRVVRQEEPAGILLGELGLTTRPGDVLTPTSRQQTADLMAGVIVDLLTGRRATQALRSRLQVATDGRSVPPSEEISHIVFSGGVSEFLVDSPPPGFGDLGAQLGNAVREKLAAADLTGKVVPAIHGIRATVLGASQFTVQATGQTCYISDPSILPVAGLRAVPVEFTGTPAAEAIRTALTHHDLDEWQGSLAAVISVDGGTSYRTLRSVATALTEVAGATAPDLPLFAVLRADLAHSLGGILKEELGWAGPVTVVDNITVGDLDHLDIGTPLGVSGSLPVTVTSLEFPQPKVAAPASSLSR